MSGCCVRTIRASGRDRVMPGISSSWPGTSTAVRWSSASFGTGCSRRRSSIATASSVTALDPRAWWSAAASAISCPSAGAVLEKWCSAMSSLAAARCLLRALPLFFRPSPGTPLRVLAIVALDTVHVLRTSRPLSRRRLEALAHVLDFQACTNAVWDGKELRAEERSAARHRWEDAGLGVHLRAYLSRLRSLEGERPPIGGEGGGFAAARTYREEVVRLSLATVAAIALDGASVDDGDLDMLFRMAILCQVIDDVLDYREDLAAGLPSFLTAT